MKFFVWVLVAAHCIKNKDDRLELHAYDVIALFGVHDLSNLYEVGRIALSPEKIKMHPDWSSSDIRYDADIAIMTFGSGEISSSKFIQPICLWNGDTPPVQIEGHVGGWGMNLKSENNYENIPKKLVVPIHTNEFCFLTTKDLVDLASNRTFCAGKGDGTGICEGDSGGGLSIKVRSIFYFRGIVSSGLNDQLGTCDVSKYSIFTDVLKVKPWIDQIINNEGKVLIPKVVRANLRCTIELDSWRFFMMIAQEEEEGFHTCNISDQKIDGEEFSVAGVSNLSIQGLWISNNEEVNFLPENVAESFPGLIRYRVDLCLIKKVNEKHFKGLNKLELLKLSGNGIESIDGDSFKDLIKLKDLDLTFNGIKTIDLNWFQSLETIRSFSIDHNQIEILDENIFDNLKNIESIKLSDNKISTIPANLFKNNLKLRVIDLSRNKIQKISPTMFNHLTNLNYVDLRKSFCVNAYFYPGRLSEIKNVLRDNCVLR